MYTYKLFTKVFFRKDFVSTWEVCLVISFEVFWKFCQWFLVLVGLWCRNFLAPLVNIWSYMSKMLMLSITQSRAKLLLEGNGKPCISSFWLVTLRLLEEQKVALCLLINLPTSSLNAYMWSTASWTPSFHSLLLLFELEFKYLNILLGLWWNFFICDPLKAQCHHPSLTLNLTRLLVS